MAANIFQSGGVNNNWGTAGNWSLGAVPTSSDGNVATFDATSPNCTVDTSARVCNHIDFTGYTNTITMDQSITISGNITLKAGLLVAGSSSLRASATGTLTSNGCVWPNGLTFLGTSQTYTLADDWDVDGTVTLAGVTATTINGNNLYVGESLTSSSTATTSGTTVFIMNGTGTWSNSSTGKITNSLTFNTAGTITVSGNVRYSGGTLTYTAGTMLMGTSILIISATTILDTGGMTWANVTTATSTKTITLLSDWNVSGNYIAGATTINETVNGAFNVNVGGNFTFNGTSGAQLGTATFVLNGTGTWSQPSRTTGYINNPVVINTAGTITLSGIISTGNTGFSLTYIAGTVDVAGSTLRIGICTLDLNDLVLNNLSIVQASTSVVTLASGLQISGDFSNGDSATHHSIVSSVADTQRKLTLLPGATQDLCKVDATDIDSSDGQTIYTHRGVLDNATNWTTFTSYARTTSHTF